MNVFRLLELASERLKTNDALFHEQADTVLGILRSAGVLPHRRSSLNGSLHKLVAAMIVQAYDDNTTIDVAVRRRHIPSLRILNQDRGISGCRGRAGLAHLTDRQGQGRIVPGRHPGGVSS